MSRKAGSASRSRALRIAGAVGAGVMVLGMVTVGAAVADSGHRDRKAVAASPKPYKSREAAPLALKDPRKSREAAPAVTLKDPRKSREAAPALTLKDPRKSREAAPALTLKDPRKSREAAPTAD